MLYNFSPTKAYWLDAGVTNWDYSWPPDLQVQGFIRPGLPICPPKNKCKQKKNLHIIGQISSMYSMIPAFFPFGRVTNRGN
jgi:hypothetical protein